MNRVVVLIFDRLSATSLGCYGGPVPTPAFDELATVSDLFEQCYVADAEVSIIDQLIDDSDRHTLFYIENEDHVTEAVSRTQRGQSNADILSVSGTFNGTSSNDFASRILRQVLQEISDETILVVTAGSGDGILGNIEIPDWMQPVSEGIAHVPLMVRHPFLPAEIRGRRRKRIILNSSIKGIVSQLTESPELYKRDLRERSALRQIQYRCSTAIATRTADWLAIQKLDLDRGGIDDGSLPRLYRKPEDCWEVLDVADQALPLIDHFEATGELRFP